MVEAWSRVLALPATARNPIQDRRVWWSALSVAITCPCVRLVPHVITDQSEAQNTNH